MELPEGCYIQQQSRLLLIIIGTEKNGMKIFNLGE